MSIKKTWFSYILWLIATGFSICFIYSNVSGLVTYLGLYGSGSYVRNGGYSVGFLLIMVAVCLGLCFLSKKITLPSVSKWVGRGLHIFILLASVVIFVVTRIQVVYHASFDTVEVMNLYEASKIGGMVSKTEAATTFLEQIYTNILSGVFLFLGNKMEVMLYVQIFLQVITFLVLVGIGWTLQKNFSSWIPAVCYAVSPLFVNASADMGAANFWFCIAVLAIGLICLLERIWKNRMITYAAVNVFGLVGGIFVWFANTNGFVDLSVPLTEAWRNIGISVPAYYIGALVFAFFVLLYCVSFWFYDRDHASFYMVPILCFSGVYIYLLLRGNGAEIFLLMLIHLYLYFVVAEGLRVFFALMPKAVVKTEKTIKEEQNREISDQWDVLIESNKTPETVPAASEEKIIAEAKTTPSNFEWWEKDGLMELNEEITAIPDEEEEAVIIRVSDIVKESESLNEQKSSARRENVEEPEQIPVIDKTAMIENVLPMPKKHVSRTLEYAFEPPEDMMHYDIEIENDDYDYE